MALPESLGLLSGSATHNHNHDHPNTETGWQRMGQIDSDSPNTFAGEEAGAVVYRVYKRRWLGLGMLMLLNIVISWGWLTFAPVSDSAQIWFELPSQTPVNWLSTVIFFAFAVASPAVIYTLNHHGVKTAILVASILTLSGNWIRYAGTRTQSFSAVMVGQILIGFAQPFVLSAPTYYSDLWFTSSGRISATALASLSNPLGAALGQLINPIIATSPEKIPGMVLWVSVIATVACVPCVLVQARPPTPPCASAATLKLPFKEALSAVLKNKEFWIVWLLFSIYLGFFNAMSSLLNQIMLPYGYTADEAGIAGAALILVGLITSAIISPLIDRTHSFLLAIKIQVPLVAACYIALIWVVDVNGALAPPYIVCAVLGAASFSLLPVVLEWVVELTHPVSPELTSSLLWCGGQVLGAVFLLVMDALKDVGDGGKMGRSLIFEAVVAAAVCPLVLVLGRGSGGGVNRRIEIDKASDGVEG
ncbi:major facilitator superfamily domain-containing protein [Morchella snyderi]|nr:major facilitator superfamily domain-containing protein [Morchella snyderi]